ncbi:MAG: 50S ribosomal protein L22 [Candidatus Omnitrophica bacterium CG07_land_8_20_14_0_80_42_15]|uniref:Large ribosomal subunit protein uL22 n=1 Tax=Candidatus Aquitaenariimonas noxiae TaxID=1974741 RepID=A0A2J0KVH5_9BACT|nr:MAG: 50S ribosomal protein L22 [Candidatus Omnitrophica bacterium CG07_land_8_20_14_0_80_42_15]
MFAKATAKFLRVSPRKVRLVADLVRHKDVGGAFAILANLKKGAAVHVKEVLLSAASNAKQKNPDLEISDLLISKLTVDGGPMMARWRAASMGRANMILKRMSHIRVELDVKENVERSKKGKRKKVKAEKTEKTVKAEKTEKAPKVEKEDKKHGTKDTSVRV